MQESKKISSIFNIILLTARLYVRNVMVASKWVSINCIKSKEIMQGFHKALT